MAQVICEHFWIRNIFNNLKKLFCDNKFAMSITYNPVQHGRKKHIEVDQSFIKEKLDNGLQDNICTIGKLLGRCSH